MELYSCQEQGFVSSPPRPNRLWGPPNLLSNEYQGVKRPGGEDDHLPPSSAEVTNAWTYQSIPPIRLHGVVLNEAMYMALVRCA